MKIIVVQPALPAYRYSFFEKIYSRLDVSFSVFFTPTSMGALTVSSIFRPWVFKLGPLLKLPFGFFWQKGISEVVIKRNDIVVLFGNPRYLNNIFFLFWSKLCGAKVVWWGHLWSSSSTSFGFYLRCFFMLISDALLFYTDEEIDNFNVKCKLSIGSRPLVYALNNGIDIDPIRARRLQYSSFARDRSLLFIGRLTEKSKFPLVLQALSLLGSNAPDLHVIGDGGQKETLMELTSRLSIHSTVTWHGGHTDEDYIAGVANRCMAFVYPGEVGLSLIHAMAYGLPAIVHSNRSHHMPEIAAFTSGETGVSFQYGDANSLAQIIQLLLNSPDLLNGYSFRAIHLADNVYNTEQMAQRFLEMIEDLQLR